MLWVWLSSPFLTGVVERTATPIGGLYYRDRKSLITKAQRLLEQSSPAVASTETPNFAKLLRRTLTTQRVKLIDLAEKLDINRCTLRSWVNGENHPSHRHLPKITLLEQLLGLPQDSLRAHLFDGPQVSRIPTSCTPTGRYMKKVRKKRYRLLLKAWPAHLRKQLDLYVKYKTVPVTDPDYARSPESGFGQTRRQQGAYKVELEHFVSFFGYLVNEHPESFTVKELSFADLGDIKLVAAFVEFQKNRSQRRCYHHGCKRFLDNVHSMTRPGSGFLWHSEALFADHPRFCSRLPKQIEVHYRSVRLPNIKARWRCWCAEQHEAIGRLRRGIASRHGFKKSRDVEKALEELLRTERPWQMVMSIESRVWAEPFPHTGGPVRRAFDFQKRLAFSYNIRWPFRAGTFSVIRRDNLHVRNGQMKLVLEPDCFKNGQYLKDQKFVATLDPFLREKTETFLKVHRPVLANGYQGDELFLLTPDKRHDPAHRHKVELFFGETLKAYTSKHLRRYVPSGIRCHALRHIVATDYIMRDPIDGYKLAAIALWESDATVYENYFHVEQEGLLRKHDERLEELRLACRRSEP